MKYLFQINLFSIQLTSCCIGNKNASPRRLSKPKPDLIIDDDVKNNKLVEFCPLSQAVVWVANVRGRANKK
jgi:hypothetical protein